MAARTLTQDNPAPEPAAASMSAAFWRVALLMAGTVIVLTLIATFSGEKLKFLYKDQLHLMASGLSTVGILIAIPNYLRPFIGAGSDVFPLLGYHRRSYYALAALLGASGFFGLSLLPHPHYWTTILLVMLTVAGGAMLMLMADTMMVTVGNKTGTVPILQGIQQILPYALFLYLAHVSGYVTQHWSYSRCFRTAALMALLTLPLTLLIDDSRVVRPQHAQEDPEEQVRRRQAKQREQAETAAALRQAAGTPGLWAVVAYVFYLTLTPSGATAQFFFMVDKLHFPKQLIGDLGQWSSAGVVLGILTIVLVSRRISIRTLVWGGWVIGTLAYLLNFALHDPLSAKLITLISSYFGIMTSLSLLTLAARACPPKVEGTIYGLSIAAIGLATTLSDKLGSMLYDFYGPTHHHSIVYGWYALNWWGFGLTALAAGLLVLMPAWSRSRQTLSMKPEVAA